MPDSTQIILRKTDKDLNTIWESAYYTHTAEAYNYAAIETDSEAVVQLCFKKTNSGTPYPTVPSKLFLVVTDSMGNQLRVDYPLDSTGWTGGKGIEETDDGGFLIAGSIDAKSFVLKTDDTCTEEWHKNYATNVSRSWLFDLKKEHIIDGNYYITGAADIFGYSAKIDVQGNVIWEKEIAVGSSSSQFNGIAPGSNGSSVYAGATTFSELQSSRSLMVKLDKDGNQLWSRVYAHPVSSTPVNFSNEIFTIAPLMLPDGGFVAAGYTIVLHPNGGFTQDGWLLRVDSNGCYKPDCSGLFPLAIKEPKSVLGNIKTYPNPTNGMLFLEYEKVFPRHTVVTLTDNLGRQIEALPSPEGKTKMQYNFKGLAPNTYFLKIVMEDAIKNIKFVIVH